MAAGLAWASSGGSRFRQDHPWWQQGKVRSGLVGVGLATSSPTCWPIVFSVTPAAFYAGAGPVCSSCSPIYWAAVLLVGPGVQVDVL